MKVTSIALAACLGMLAPTLALAQNAPYSEPAPSVQPTSTNPSGQPLICKYYADNGRILPRRDCRTANEWERIRNERQREIVDMQRRASTGGM
jgi:hypothetical protein